jgi:protein-S-isoprenylcysteine O-methyltransferase Ste14
MHWGLVITIIVLPGTVLVFIPAIILLLTRDSWFSPEFANPSQIWFWLALLPASIGFALCVWTVKGFIKHGEGTPAPWDPPRKLVIRGPYGYSRNPMITGVLLLLLAEALFFHSWPIAAWMILFFLGNAIYFPLVEEKELEKRYGDEYLKYKAHVPRWIPRLPPREKSEGEEQNTR